MTDLYFSRARLRPDVPASALRALLVPVGESARAAAGHHLVWTLFADSPARERDFLWRESEPGRFYVLSRRPPEDRHGLFEPLEPAKPFAPELNPGDRLKFALRANATTSRVSEGAPRANGRIRGKPCDVVMDALHALPVEQRAAARSRVACEAGLEWLSRQGERAGFDVEKGTTVTGYRTLRIEHGRRPARLGVLDFEGLLTVREPERLIATIASGFGRGKAFGCGLMLVRRA